MINKKKQITIKQHTIPKFLIKNFGDKVWVANKEKTTVTLRNPKTTTVIPNFYEKNQYEANLIEDKLAINETEVSKIIKLFIDSDSDVSLSPKQTTELVRFLWTMSDRTIHPLTILEYDPKDIWEFLAKERGGDVGTIHKDLLDDLEADIATEIKDYRKWRKNMIKKVKGGLERIDGSLKSEYKLWNKSKKYSWGMLRSLTDYSASKIMVISAEYDVNVLTNTFSFGQRNTMGAVMYYTFPISPTKSILVILENYSNDQNPFHNLSKSSKRLSFKLDYIVKQFLIPPQLFFESTMYGLNEEQSFIIAKDLPSLFGIILKFHQYVKRNGYWSKADHLWVCKFIKDNLDEEYNLQAEAKNKIYDEKK